MLRSKDTPVINESKPASPEVKSETPVVVAPITERKESPKPIPETAVDRAKNRLNEAESHLKDKNYIYAICHYINAITNAKNAIESKLNSDPEMFNLIDQSIRNLLIIASEQNDLFEKCQPDAKVKLALILSIFTKDDNFKKNIPIFNEKDNEEKTAPLFRILQNNQLIISTVDKHQDIAELFTRSMKLNLKHLTERKTLLDGQATLEEKKPTFAAPPTTIQPSKNDSKLAVSSNYGTLFSKAAKPVALSMTGVLPGMTMYSMANVSWNILLWGGFYGFLATAIPIAAYHASHKLAEYCKGNKP